MAISTDNINALWTSLMVEELVRNGVRTFCLSPGSRCTPLTVAVAAHPDADATVHYDERGAAFFALGHVKATGNAAALICTSGTAAANYVPAVVEASQARVPLILLTADRPPELLDTGANQTIDQTRIFGEYVRWHVTVPCPDQQMPPTTLLTTIDQAVYRAQRSPQGPVHLNCMFREPLAPTSIKEDLREYLAPLAAWEATGTPYTRYVLPETVPTPEEIDAIAQRINKTARGLLVIGELVAKTDRAAAHRLIAKLGWPVFADITSGLDGQLYHDAMLVSPTFRAQCLPETVLHLGGSFTSKRLLQFLENAQPDTYIRVADHPFRHDPAHIVTDRIEANLVPFCDALSTAISPNSEPDWLHMLDGASQKAGQTIDAFLDENDTLSELAVARLVRESIQGDDILFPGNSMPIRDAGLVAPNRSGSLSVFANRGASGIDGNVATAAGFAHGAGRPVTALLGDLALLHDLNSLALLARLQTPVIIVVINNNGGGIFHFLPIAAFEEYFEEFFGTPHGLGFAHAAAQFNLDYYCPASKDEFQIAYRIAQEKGVPAIIEVATDRAGNARVHQALHDAIATALK